MPCAAPCHAQLAVHQHQHPTTPLPHRCACPSCERELGRGGWHAGGACCRPPGALLLAWKWWCCCCGCARACVGQGARRQGQAGTRCRAARLPQCTCRVPCAAAGLHIMPWLGEWQCWPVRMHALTTARTHTRVHARARTSIQTFAPLKMNISLPLAGSTSAVLCVRTGCGLPAVGRGCAAAVCTQPCSCTWWWWCEWARPVKPEQTLWAAASWCGAETLS